MTDDSSPDQEINPRVKQALAYQARGWRVIQLHGIQKDGVSCTCVKQADCRSAGKHPVENEWQALERMTPEQIEKAWDGWRRNHNVGIATGTASGFWVLDIDPDKGGLESAKRLATEHPAMFDPTVVVKTGSGGFHYYFNLPDFDVTNSPGALKGAYPGIDVRGNGGQVVAPPSVTDKGAYRIPSYSSQEIADAPPWLLDMLRPKVRPTLTVAGPVTGPITAPSSRLAAYAQKAWDGEVARLVKMAEAAVPEGQQYVGEPWDATTFEVACNLLELANADWTPYTQADAENAVYSRAPRDSSFKDEDVRTKIESALKKVGENARPAPADRGPIDISDWDIPGDHGGQTRPPEPTREWPMRSWDDHGNGLRMYDHYGHNLRYIPAKKRWALYDGGRWAEVDASVVSSLVGDLFASGTGRLARTEAMMYDDTPGTNANGDPTPSDRERFFTWIGKQRMSARLLAGLGQATAQVALHATPDDFDADPMLFNVANGVIELNTGDLIDHDPDLMLMKQSPVTYDPLAPCHGWQSFLDRVMPDKEMQSYLQRIVGYSMTGAMNEQAFFIHHGAGANGKSVFLQVMRAVVGDYGQSVPRDTLLAKKNAEHPTSVARMAGMRFLEVSETAPGKKLDEEMVKGLTGGEKQTARMMGQDFFDFTPTGKIHYVTNHLPRLSDAQSIWRRLHLIRWGVRIPESEQNQHLAEELIHDELPGILAWCIRGAVAWSQQRLDPPAAAAKDVEHYREDADAFGEFLTEHTVDDETSMTKTNDLYLAYKGWAFSAGVKLPMSQQAFTAVMKERGYEYARRANGRFFKGVRVVSIKVDSPWHES